MGIIFVSALCLFLYFMGVVIIQQKYQTVKYVTEPPGLEVSCSETRDKYGKNFAFAAYYEAKYYDTQYDKSLYFANMKDLVSRTGALSCFCSLNKAEGKKPDDEY